MSIINKCITPQTLEQNTTQLKNHIYITKTLKTTTFNLHTLHHKPKQQTEHPHNIQTYQKPQTCIDQKSTLTQ